MRCSKCGAENPDRAKFCGECASPFTRPCSSCGTENSLTTKFCIECAKPLEDAGKLRRAPDEGTSIRVSADISDTSLEGERKTVTMLFADIKGSTELMEDLDPEEAQRIVDPALNLMIEAVRRYDGYIPQSTGDGIFALFGAPIAHEDHPRRALHAALRMQEDLRRYSAKLVAEGGMPIQCRVGANTGEVVVRTISTGDGQREYAPIGHTTNLASRMQAVAPVGSIAVTDQIRKLCEGYFVFKSLGPTKVKGVSEPVSVYEVTGLGPLRTRLQRSASRGYTKFVGRKREMETVKHAAELAKTGHGRIVAAVADPGVGKSRLFDEFKARNQSDWMVLEALSFSHGKASAYLPVLDLLQTYFGIEPEDDSRKRREKVNGKVLTLDRALEDALPHLLGLLGLNEGDDSLAGMDVQVRQRRTVEALKRVLFRESLNQPLMVIFEDLHWIDQETQAFLNLLADSIGTAKILLLVNYRPEYSHSWSSKSYYTQLRLDPLVKESAGEMLDALLGVNAQAIDSQLAALRRLIIEKTEGNPLFMEEIVQALTEEGALVSNGEVKLTRPLAALKVPPTVQDIIASRIDRLPAVEKELLQTLAVIGMEFTLALAGVVTKKPDDELNRLLNDLQLAELIYEQPAMGDVEYTFKHALTHDVAYNSLLTERRKLLHQRIRQAIEKLFARSIDDHVSELAHHYSRSANKRKAVEFLGHAGRRAAERSAYAEALGNISNALQLLKELPDDLERARIELDLEATLNQLVLPMTDSTASAEVEQSCMRMRRLSERVGEHSRLLDAIRGLSSCYMVRGELEKAKAYAYEGLALATQDGAQDRLVGAHFQLAQTFLHMGEFTEAVKHCREAEAVPHMLTELGGRRQADATIVTKFVLAQSLCCLGFPDQARQIERNALSEARNVTTCYVRAAVMAADAGFQQVLGDAHGSLEQTDAGMSYAAEKGVMSQLRRMTPIRAGALVKTGSIEEGITMLRETIARSKARLQLVRAHCSLAEAYQATGKPDEGLEMLRDAQDLMDQTGERHWAADLFRLRGELLLQGTPAATVEAEASFHEAIEVARQQSAKWYELRVTTSLARLLRDNNRRDEARALLAEIYNWFTEGFDTADLKDAKTLLDELGT